MLTDGYGIILKASCEEGEMRMGSNQNIQRNSGDFWSYNDVFTVNPFFIGEGFNLESLTRDLI